MAVYAINGFNDVQFNIQSSLPSTTILCSSTASDFDQSCTVTPTWPHNQCIDDQLSCNPTHAPTEFPTISPTQKPSTFPTKSPSLLPSVHPSIHPSQYPTN